ncbi:hypothetical protein HU200_015207 [Digitaria exilis]|uniref:Uncharacterized protein n=1 Tax=Digitaria exilis TaxID=1010633 RepID=A0A835FB09_9POAL|nr:hypothetical protein HU200_015207 [Digitaria exilis]
MTNTSDKRKARSCLVREIDAKLVHYGTYDANPAWLVGAGFLVLTLSSGAALYRAAGDPATVSFVVASYVTLLLLFVCLRAYERSPAALRVPPRLRTLAAGSRKGPYPGAELAET